MGCAFGAFMGLLIDALKIPAFIITLAGMFFLRGVSYLVSEESIPINHPIYDTLSSLAWKIPGGGRLSAMGLLMLAVVVIGIFLAHRTRFGNQVYAIGGNATSANLMGISTRSTTIRIYIQLLSFSRTFGFSGYERHFCLFYLKSDFFQG